MKRKSSRIAAFMDMGTNSVRLMIVRFDGPHSFTTLSRQKEMIRLGEGQFDDNMIKPGAIQRAVDVCRNFAVMAKTFKAEEIVAVATSAVRDAANQKEFLKRLIDEAGLHVNVVSGKEEARLIYLGVSSGARIETQALFIDIGGGSTELIVGDSAGYSYLDSLKLGAVRLGMIYTDGIDGPVPQKLYTQICEHVRNSSIRSIQAIKGLKIKESYGSSETAQNLAEISRQVIYKGDESKKFILKLRDLKQVSRLLCSLPLSQRRNVPGINPKRADIIVAGAAILETILEETRMQEIKISGRELRDGLLIDYLDRIGAPEKGETSIRLRSVLGLGRKCGFDEQHAMNVSRIALEMFDTGREIWLHRQGSGRRDLLHFAALLHDVGSFLSYNNHHLNSWYFIRNSDLLGFNQREIALIAADAFFHRRGIPGRKYPEAYGLDDRALETVKVHAILLRFAESLDRSHAGIVRHARFSRGEKNSVVLEIECGDECDLEIWGVQNHRESFQKVFEKRLMIKRV